MFRLLQQPMFCKYYQTEQNEQNFEVASIVKGKAYRRLKCRSCKQSRQNQRRQEQYSWISEYKKTMYCSKCGFSDYRALDFHHLNPNEKDFAVADLVSRGASLTKIKKKLKNVSFCV